MRFRHRLVLLYVLFCTGMGLVWLRSTSLAMLEGDAWEAAAREKRRKSVVLEPLRGPIRSADGVVLAEDLPVFQLAVVGWDWQRRDRARCSACGTILHPRGVAPRFPATCPCQRGRRLNGDAAGLGAPVPPPGRLERLPPGDLGALEATCGLEPGEIARRAAARLEEIDRLVEVLRRQYLEAGDDTPFLRQRLELREQDLLARPYVIVSRVPEEAARLVLTDEEGRYEGLQVDTAMRRSYPLGDFAPQLIGFTSQLHSREEYEALEASHGITLSTRVGRRGIERAYNWQVHGVPGRQVLELDDDGRFSRVVEHEAPQPGRTLDLSLLAGVTLEAQAVLERAATPEGYVPGGRPSGAFVLLDADTGEILVWAEAPRFDLDEDLDAIHDPRRVEAEPSDVPRVWRPRHDLDPEMDLGAWQEAVVAPVPVSLSRVAQVAVEPGSTVKPLMGLGMLDSGLSLPFATFVCGPGGGKPHCHHCGAVDLVAAIARSCNRYFAYSLRDSSHWPIYRRSVAAFLADVGFGHAPSGEILEWSSGVWLQDGWDFPVAEALAAARRRLAASLGARAPVLDLRVMPGAPDTLGGDPERLGAGLAEVAGWMAARSGAGRLALVVAREETVGSRVDVRFEMRAAERAPWFRLPGLSDDAGLPPVLRGRAPDRGGVNGAVERGGSVWFVARFDRDLGRAGPQAAPAIRPDDGRNVAIGQGPVLVTPLHMARAMAVLANGGRLVEPHVVRTIGGVRTAHETRALDVDPRHLARIRQGMYEVVNDPAGTADRCAWHLVPGTVYGKTGTAQVGGTWRPWGLTEDGGPWHHWFVGFAEAPGRRTVAFACVLHARDEAAGGLTAAPACREILTRFYASVASRRPTEPPCDR